MNSNVIRRLSNILLVVVIGVVVGITLVGEYARQPLATEISFSVELNNKEISLSPIMTNGSLPFNGTFTQFKDGGVKVGEIAIGPFNFFPKLKIKDGFAFDEVKVVSFNGTVWNCEQQVSSFIFEGPSASIIIEYKCFTQ